MTVELVLLPRVAFRGTDITGSRLGGLLALLADDLRRGRGTGGLVAALWPDEQPEHPVKALQVLVARARARLGPDVIVSTPTGYRLALAEDQVDASAVLAYAAGCDRYARAGDHVAALRDAEAGLALFEEVASWAAAGGDPLSALRAARASTHRDLARARALALSRLGRHAEAFEPLTDAVRRRPRDEELLAELLRCEAATVSTAAALARYDAYRRALRADLGSDPGPELRGVHRVLLLADTPPVRRGVRQEPNPLLGRDKDVATVLELLRTARVVSIVGPGGLGKTRLAHAVARRAEHRVVQVVGLAGIGRDDDVIGEVATALDAAETGGPVGRLGTPIDPITGIVNALGSGPTLLVLDNCEHVVRGAAELVRRLVAHGAELRVLTTSRAPLGLSSESVYPLPELEPATAAELFGQRARAARPDIELPPTMVTELCAQLDGLPLALELAAARVRTMSVPEIAQRLDHRFALLRGGPRDAPRRHRTLHAVIDWSWRLLEPAERAAMRALSVFPDGFTADAARHILVHDDVAVREILERLVDQSLLKAAETTAGTRLRMLETVREFAAERRVEYGDDERIVEGFVAWATEFALARHESMFASLSALEELRSERDNLARALRYGLDRADGAVVAATAAVLGGLWLAESNFTRLIALADETASVLSHFRPSPRLVEITRAAAVLCALFAFLSGGSRVPRTLVTLRRLPRATPDSLVRATDIVLCAPGLPALRELADGGQPLVAAMAGYALSYVWEGANDPDEALRAAKRAIAPAEASGLSLICGLVHGRVAELCLEAEPGDAAYRHLTAALSVVQELGWWHTATRTRWALVLANLQRGAYDEAERGLARALQDADEDMAGLPMFDICARAEIALGRGDVEDGLDLWRQAAQRLRYASGESFDAPAWAWEVQAVAVVSHARHGRLDRIADVVETLPAALTALLGSMPPVSAKVCGVLLVALAVADLDHGAARSGVPMVALAERFGWPRGFHPAMSPARIRALAERADRPAYRDAVSGYAGLDQAGLRAAALAALRERRLSVAGPA